MWVNHSAGRWVALSVARSCAARWAAFFVDNGRSLRALRQTCGSVGSRLSRLLRSGSLRLAAQDVALSRRKQGFESPRERHPQNLVLSFQNFFAKSSHSVVRWD